MFKAKHLISTLLIIIIIACKHDDGRLNNATPNNHRSTDDSIADIEFNRLTDSMHSFEIKNQGESVWLQSWYSCKQYHIDTASMSITIENKWHSGPIIIKHRLGTFYGINEGESYGRLAFTRNNGMNTTLIDDDNIHAIIPLGDSIVILTSLAPIGEERGVAYILKQVGDAFEVNYEISLGGSPQAHYRYHDTLYIATSSSIDAVYDRRSTILMRTKFWGVVYPRSIYVNSKYVFVGASGCLFVVNRSTKTMMQFRRNSDADTTNCK